MSTQPTPGAMRAAHALHIRNPDAALSAARIMDSQTKAPELLASLAKLVTWADVYAQANGIDTYTAPGPLSQDCREARALLKQLSP